MEVMGMDVGGGSRCKMDVGGSRCRMDVRGGSRCRMVEEAKEGERETKNSNGDREDGEKRAYVLRRKEGREMSG